MIKLNGNILDTSDIKNNISYFLLKRLIKDFGLNISKVVRMMNENNSEHKTTPQNLSNKLSRDTLKVSEFIKLVEICGYTICFNNENYKEENKYCNIDSRNDYLTLFLDGYSDCKSINFRTIIIAGANAIKAAKWIEDNQNDNMDTSQEIILLIAANRKFNVYCKPIDIVD